LNLCLSIDPEKRPTVVELMAHKFVNMTGKEIKESKEASHLISFCSIVASQNSVNEKKKSIYSNMASEINMQSKTYAPHYSNTKGEHTDYGKWNKQDHDMCIGKSNSSFVGTEPKIEIRVSQNILNKIAYEKNKQKRNSEYPSKKSESSVGIVTSGSINIDGMTNAFLSSLE